MHIRMKELAQVIGGEIRQGNPGLMLNGVSTDSRAPAAGRIFFALAGEKFDGHKFVREVARKGASAAVVKQGYQAKVRKDFGLILVEDPLFALGELARYQRSRLSAKVIGITGSVGKTTCKEMAALILGRKFKTAKSSGNFNNLIGLPLTIFQIPADAEAAVLELASNRPGEIARLSEIAQAEIGVITKIAEAHLLGFEDLPGVEREKRALAASLGAKGIFIFNLADPRLARLARGFAGRKIGFGFKAAKFRGAELEVRADRVRIVLKGGQPEQRFTVKVRGAKNERQEIILRGLGEHLVENALGAIAVGSALGIGLKECAKALQEFRPMPGRGKVEEIRSGLWLIDESYNANPASFQQALRLFSEYGKWIPGKKIVVAGEMKELGKASARAHRELGRLLRQLEFDRLYYVGGFYGELVSGLGSSGARKARKAKDLEQLKTWLAQDLDQGLVLLKASHAVGLWEIAERLRRK